MSAGSEPSYGVIYYITPENAVKLRALTRFTNDDGHNVEICSFLSKQEINSQSFDLIPDRDHMWPGSWQEYSPGQFRGTCSWTYKKGQPSPDFLYHTHPADAYSYPSIEDIANVLQYRDIKASIIGCNWGLWIIKPAEGSHGFLQQTKKMRAKILDDADEIYLSEIGRIEDILGHNSTLSDSKYNQICTVVKNLGIFLRMNIAFYRWEDIKVSVLV